MNEEGRLGVRWEEGKERERKIENVDKKIFCSHRSGISSVEAWQAAEWHQNGWLHTRTE